MAVSANALAAGPFTQVSSGATHSCGIAQGAAYCWGDDHESQLGPDQNPWAYPKVLVNRAIDSGATAVSAGGGPNADKLTIG